MSITIVFNCDGCGKRYELPGNLAGKKAACKDCGTKFEIPTPRAPRAAAPQSAPVQPQPRMDRQTPAAGPAARPAQADPRQPNMGWNRPPAASPPPQAAAGPAAEDLYGLDEAPMPSRRPSTGPGPARSSASDDLADILPKRAPFPSARPRSNGSPKFNMKTAIAIPCSAVAFALAWALGYGVVSGRIDLGSMFTSLTAEGPYDKVIKDLIQALDDLGDILEKIHSQADAASQTAALQEIEQRARRIMSDFQALPKPSAIEDRRLGRRYESKLKASIARVTTQAQRLQTLAGVPGFRMPTMTGFPGMGGPIGFGAPPTPPAPFAPPGFNPGPRFTLPPAPTVTGDTVQIVVSGISDQEHADYIGEQIGALLESQPKGSRNTFTGGGGVNRTWNVTPLQDVPLFVEGVKFGKVTSSNAKKIEIVATPLTADQRRPPESDFIGRSLYDLRSPVSHRRTDAARKLAEAIPSDRREEVAKALLPLLNDNEAWARREAVRALGVWGSADEVPALIGRINDNDGGVSGEVIKALGRRKDPRGASAVVGLFDKHRGEARDALIAMGPAAEEAVLELLRHQDVFVRSEACKILQEIGGAKSLPKLQVLARRQGFDADAARTAIRTIRESNAAESAPAPTPDPEPAAKPAPTSPPAESPSTTKPSGSGSGKSLPKGRKLGGGSTPPPRQ